MKVAIAGARTLPHGHAGRLLLTFLVSLPEDTVILLRKGQTSPANHFETQVSSICSTIGLKVEWITPEKKPGLPPREATWQRDMRYVDEADVVLCFYSDDKAEDAGGTRGLVDKAAELDTPVYGYLMARHGNQGWTVQLDGSDDPKGVWVDRVPQP